MPIKTVDPAANELVGCRIRLSRGRWWAMPVAKAHTFGERLRQLREARGWVQEQLADVAGVSTATISRIEAGLREPGWGTVVKLARALGVSVAAFDEPEPPRRRKK